VATGLLATGFLLSGIWFSRHDLAVTVAPGARLWTTLAGVSVADRDPRFLASGIRHRRQPDQMADTDLTAPGSGLRYSEGSTKGCADFLQRPPGCQVRRVLGRCDFPGCAGSAGPTSRPVEVQEPDTDGPINIPTQTRRLESND
jgi:hypothetical protein